MATLSGRRVLVTGASGFIGSHLIRRLVHEGAQVHAVSRGVTTPQRLADVEGRIVVHHADLSDVGALTNLATSSAPEIVFHLAGHSHVGTSWDKTEACIATNIQGTVNLLFALASTGYERLVFASSGDVYGNVEPPLRESAHVEPMSPYAVSKYAGERFCRMYEQAVQWPIVIARTFNTYGPFQSLDRVVPETIAHCLEGRELLLTTGRQTREFNYVDDITDAYVRLATTAGVDGEAFNIGCGEEVSIRDVVETIVTLMGDPIEPSFGALEHRPHEIWRMFSDPTKARERLGWIPRHTLTDGLAATIQWYREHLPDEWRSDG